MTKYIYFKDYYIKPKVFVTRSLILKKQPLLKIGIDHQS